MIYDADTQRNVCTDDYSGGGFMANSSPQSGSQNSPGGERVRVRYLCLFFALIFRHPISEKRTANQSLRPVTIKQILKAEQTHSDAELYLDGVEVSQVRLPSLGQKPA